MPTLVFLHSGWLLILTYLFCPVGRVAQPNSTISAGYDTTKQPECSIPLPTVAALGKFGLTPVSNYSGMPQVSIPIQEVKGKKLRAPIALSFNSGLKVTEEAGWVGLG